MDDSKDKQSKAASSITLVSAGDANDVRAMYERFPYPSPIIGDSPIKDLANNLVVLFSDATLEGKRILDAGCGTGHRLLGAAKKFPSAHFTGLDMTTASLNVAKELAQKHNADNVSFVQDDLLNLKLQDKFDIIVSTGVVHHLEDPNRGLKNLSRLLKDDGVMNIWHYHSLGEHQRLCDRELYLNMLGGDRKDHDKCLSLLEDLKFSLDVSQYGSSAVQSKTADVSRTNIDIDAYLHPIVNAYRFQEAIDLFDGCDVQQVAISGLNTLGKSKLIDLAEVDDSEYASLNISVEQLFDSDSLQQRFRRLDNRSKLKVIELKLRPTGLTVVAGKGKALENLSRRLAGNI